MSIRRALTTVKVKRPLFTSARLASQLPKRSIATVKASLPKQAAPATVPFSAKKNYQHLFAKTLAVGGAVAMATLLRAEKEGDAQDLIKSAQQLDDQDPFKALRDQFIFPTDENGKPLIYLNGNSLGLSPIDAQQFVLDEMKAWGEKGVRGHFDKENPWVSYGDLVKTSLARLVNAKPSEVVAMGGLTANLNNVFISFYRPTKDRYKVIRLADGFGSDRYAIDSQIHQRVTTIKDFVPGAKTFDPKEAVIEIKPKEGTKTITTQEIIDVINQHGDSASVVFIEGVNYLSGQNFDLKAISEAAHAKGCYFGVDLAHSVGNTFPHLHDDQVDFAVWCHYKYVNSGPGAVAGMFVHEKHHANPDMPRLSGWWGQNMSSRFDMTSRFSHIPSADAWQQSNPPIWQLASLRASLAVFDKVDLNELRAKSQRLTAYMEKLLKEHLPDDVEIITPSNPEDRGSQLSLKVKMGSKVPVESLLHKQGVICDARGEIIRVAPAALYNNYEDVARFVIELKKLCQAHKLQAEVESSAFNMGPGPR